MSKVEEANFSVGIKGLKVPQDVAKRMEDEIRQTVMKELGKIDLTGYQFTFSRLRPVYQPLGQCNDKLLNK